MRAADRQSLHQMRKKRAKRAPVAFDEILKLSRRIEEAFRPVQIVLFGSYARSDPTADSDIDLLVVLPFEGKAAAKSVEIRLRVRPSFPLDLIVRTPENIQERLAIGDGFIREILSTGKVLYNIA